uniref:Uncharacterized protein n=1 Tax=Candidatus Kentrum sp. TC TaxID=2126339 RepID=A0A450ZGE2_9GAMM|nr:MAG: hypothetical protein BECKTC1821D_GA0114238_12222 [Candidatus Kentron sp. TC]
MMAARRGWRMAAFGLIRQIATRRVDKRSASANEPDRREADKAEGQT